MTSNMAPFTDVESNGSKVRSSPSNKSKKEEYLVVAVVILAIVLLAFVIAVIVLAVKSAKHSTSGDVCTTHDCPSAGTEYPTYGDVCTTHGCLTAALELLEAMNTTVDPCDDFYQFACGKWTATNTGDSPNKLVKAITKADFEISENINKAANDPDMPISVRKIASAYITCVKYGDLKETDIRWLRNILHAVGGWPLIDKDWKEQNYHWERNLALAIHNLSINAPFGVTIDVNYFDTRKYIINIKQYSVEEMEPFDKEKILSIAKRIGNRANDNSLETEYQEVEEFAQKLRKMSRSAEEALDDPNDGKVLTIKELKEIIPWGNWKEFLLTIFGQYLRNPLHESDSVLLLGTNYISKFMELAFNGGVTRRTLANFIGAYFIQKLIGVNSNIGLQNAFLSSKDSSGYLLKESLPQGYSSECLSFISEKGSYAVDFINHKMRKTKYMDDKMLDYSFSAMKDLIKTNNWLDEKTKQAALEKLEQMKHYSGFPELAKHANKVEEYFRELPDLTESALQNQLKLQHYLFKKQVELLSKNVDRNSWPTAVGGQGSQLNAFYVPDINGIVIPAFIQTDPIFSPEKPSYWNFGLFGWVLGHEITHGFDTSGSKRDKYGNVRNWWEPQAKEEFERRSRCFIEQYDKIDFGYEGTHVNGTQTVGENVADNGGLRQAFIAYKKWEKDNGKEKLLPGLEKYDTYQLFFIAGIQPYCSINMSPEDLYVSSIDDPHTPTGLRGSPAMSNSEDFANVFKCKSGSPMNPVKKCVIW